MTSDPMTRQAIKSSNKTEIDSLWYKIRKISECSPLHRLVSHHLRRGELLDRVQDTLMI
jgi:hypothetical protein